MSKKKSEDPANPDTSQTKTFEAEEIVADESKKTEAETPISDLIEKDTYLRLAAEYDNFRKRSQKEKESTYADAKANTVAALLPVYDNLERALKNACADESFKKGVEMTMIQFSEILEKLGVREIPAENCPFDATMHNAVMHVDDDAFGENTVVECFQKGFKIGDKVIRFAMVKVAN